MAWVDIYDRHSNYVYGPLWQQAKKMAKDRIVSNLKKPSVVVTIYGDLAQELKPVIDFGTPHNPHFHCLLGQISDEEEEQGRGLLSAVVVRKEDPRPGAGFFHGADSQGRDTTNEMACWTTELNRLLAIWT